MPVVRVDAGLLEKLVLDNMEKVGKAEKLDQPFALVFTNKTCSQTTVYISRSWRLEGQASVGNSTVASAWRTWMYPALRGWMKFSWVLKELAYEISQCINSLFSLTNLVIGRGLWQLQTCSKSLRSGKGKKWPRKPHCVKSSQLHFCSCEGYAIWNPFTGVRWARRYSEIVSMGCLLQWCDCVEKERTM